MESLDLCLICGSSESLQKNFLTIRDNSLTGEDFAVTKCGNCTALLTDPRPTASAIGKYYDFPEYISHRDNAPGLINGLYRLARRWTTSRKTALINQLVKDKKGRRSLLDYGCGTGIFLQAAQQASWQVRGVEVNEQARESASNRLGTEIAAKLDHLPTRETYDVITLWHVLEHVHTPQETMSKLFSRLNEDGKLLIAVPNTNSLDAKKYGEWWAAYDVPRHLYHFTPLAIRKLCETHDAHVTEQIGQPLDSFYISLLSEKYKRGSFWKGWINGALSFLSAQRTKDYSSVIYLVQRRGK